MSFDEPFDKLQRSISLLEKRISKLETLVLDQKNNQQQADQSGSEHVAPESILDRKINFESFSGASQLGWLGIVISLIFVFFFIHYSFQKNWITGFGQPIILAILGLVFFVVADLIRTKYYRKFGAALALLSTSLFLMALYWSSIKYALTSHHFLLFASFGLWFVFLVWSVARKDSLWLQLGLLGGGLLPIFIIGDFMGSHGLIFYYLTLVLLSLVVTFLKDWSSLSLVATWVLHLFILTSIREVNLQLQIEPVHFILWKVTLFPAILILWSGLLPLIHQRPAKALEKFIWSLNNIIIYFYIFAFWAKFNKPWLLIIPLILNSLLYFYNWFQSQEHEFLFLVGMVISTAIALTIFMPIPLDIITLCLFAVFLGHKANKEEGWHLKSVSGAMIIWCLLFLFSMRFHLATHGDMPFFNLKFASFVITFLCFGYQGRMINNDLKAKHMGPPLGQGLFSLGLAVLLLGLGSEIINVFPSEDKNQISQLALLFLTVLGGVFAFSVAYVGVVLKLFFIRTLSIILYFLLVCKLLFFDFFRLELLYLVISLGCVGLLLGGTSVLLKNKLPQIKKTE